MWAFSVFSDPGFLFCFHLFQVCGFEKSYKKKFQRPYPQPRLQMVLVFDFSWVFSANLCAIGCVKKLELSQQKTVRLRFRIFTGVTFFRLVSVLQN